MASKDIVCLEREIQRTKEIDVYTMYSIFNAIICHIQTLFHTHSITCILDLVIKQKQLSLAKFLTLLYSGYVQAVTGGCQRDLRTTGKLWLSYKKFVDSKKDKPFKRCYKFLSSAFRKQMLKVEGKQEAVDRFAISTWFQVQQYEDDKCEKRKTILGNMIDALPDGVDRTVAEIVYYSKMATTAEFENDIESAQDFASKAKYLSETYEDKTAKILAHYSYFFLHRRLYLRNKNKDNREKVLEQCNIGCDMFPVPDKDGDFEKYCAMLFLLYKAGDFLQITYELEVLDADKLAYANAKAAEEVLKSASRYLDVSTPRKQLTFKFCMGRLYHLQSDFEKASRYLNETKELMKGGVLNKKEEENVYRYCRRFEEELRWESIIHQDSERAKETANELIEQHEFPLHHNMLHKLLMKFGRKDELFLRLSHDLCHFIKSKNNKIVHVYPSYKITADKEVIFVVIVEDMMSEEEEDEVGYTIKQRLIDEFSPEGEHVMFDKTFPEADLSAQEKQQLKDCMNKHATELMQRHKYISIIAASSVRSKGYGSVEFRIQKEPCIVLYVHTKGYIPIDEDPFNTDYDGVRVDVREGVFVPYPGDNPTATAYHEQLKMGCCIGGVPNAEGVKQSGTLGGYIEHPQYGLCGITCAHTLLNPEHFVELKAQGGRIRWPDFYPYEGVFQPGDSDRRIGQLVQVVYVEGGSNESGVEAALFQIEDRHPVEGDFSGDVHDIRFNTGKTYGLSRLSKAPLIKFGRTTEKTIGELSWCQQKSSIKSILHKWHHGGEIVLHNQLEILPESLDTKFADFGDSGSLVFMKGEADEYVCVAMVEGGTSYGATIATPITPILDKFNVFKLKSFQQQKFETEVRTALQTIMNDIREIKLGMSNPGQTQTGEMGGQDMDTQ